MIKIILFVFVLFSFSAKAVELTPENTIFLLGPINPFSMAMVSMDLDTVRESPAQQFYLVIHSPGGMLDPVNETAPIAAKLKNLHSVSIVAMSGAAAMSQAVGGKRYLVPRGRFLFHRIRQYLEGPITSDVASNISKAIKKADKPFAQLCRKRMNISLSEYMKRVQGDWIFGIEEALRVEAVDGVETFTCSEALKAAGVFVPTFDTLTGMAFKTNFCDLLN